MVWMETGVVGGVSVDRGFEKGIFVEMESRKPKSRLKGG